MSYPEIATETAPPAPSWQTQAAGLPARFRSALLRGSPTARACRGVAWTLLGSGVSQGAALLLSIVTARLLGKGPYGAFGMVQSTAGVFGTFAGMGLGVTATKYVAELRWVDARRAGRIATLTLLVALCSGLASGLTLILLSRGLAASTLNAPHLGPQLEVASALLLATVLCGAQAGVLAGLEVFDCIARVNIVRGILTVLGGVIGAWEWGLEGAVGALAISAAFVCIAQHVSLVRACRQAGLPLRVRGVFEEWPVVWRFSLPVWLGSALVGPVIWWATAILVNQPGGYGEMGVFNAANQWRNVVLFLPAILAQPLLPVLADSHARQPARFEHLMWLSLAVTAVLSALIVIPLCVASPWIMASYGPHFREAWPVLCMLIASAIPAACCGVVGQALAGSGRVWTGFGLNLVWAMGLIGLTLAGKRHGAGGLSAAFLGSYLLHLVIVGAYLLFGANSPSRRNWRSAT